MRETTDDEEYHPVQRARDTCTKCGTKGHRKNSKRCTGMPVRTSFAWFYRRSLTPSLQLSDDLVQRTPTEIWTAICERVEDPLDIITISRVSRLMADIVSNSNAVFWKRWEAQTGNTYYLQFAGKWGPRRSLTLIARVGCEICGKPRIRKVYPFGVRCCDSCLKENTVCEYYLPRTLHDLDLPVNQRQFPNGDSGWKGYYTARFYWRAHLDAHVRECFHTRDLADYLRLEEEKRVAALEARREARRKRQRVRASNKAKLLRRLNGALSQPTLSPRLRQLVQLNKDIRDRVASFLGGYDRGVVVDVVLIPHQKTCADYPNSPQKAISKRR